MKEEVIKMNEEITLLNGKIRIRTTGEEYWKWQVNFEEKTTSYDNEPEMWYEIISRLEKRRSWGMKNHFAIMEKDDKVRVAPSGITGEYIKEYLRNGWDLLGSFDASNNIAIYRPYNDDINTAVYLLDPQKIKIVKFQDYYNIYEVNESHYANTWVTYRLINIWHSPLNAQHIREGEWKKIEIIDISDLKSKLLKNFQGSDRWFNPEIISKDNGIEIPRKERIEVGSWENSNNWGTFYVRKSDFEMRVGLVEKVEGEYDIGDDDKIEKALKEWYKTQKI